MPDKLKVKSNERIDLVDYVLGANDYTSSTSAFVNKKTLLDNRPRILEGFYVEISDQATLPGQITIFNGFALDRTGTPVNDESLANSSSTVTLAGASQSFYVEVEFIESESVPDSRAFWDPTIDNASPIPSGGEVTTTTATRITPNWKIVQPVSTSGFAITSNPNSNRIPIALLNTNVSNQITGAVNTFGSLVNASTKAETDAAVGVGSVRVIDSKLFTVGSQFTYDFGGTNPETVKTVTSNDLDNNIISFTPVLTFAHQAGAIIRQSAVTGRYLPQTLDPSDPTFTAALPTGRPNDQELRMWQGNEIRGSAFLASKSTFGARNDLDIRTLKDEVDFLAAMIRDMKFGSPRTDVTSIAPPSTFAARPRYFDAAGGITGARTASVSIGNGTTTFGDFNGTSQATFIAAENALPASGGTIYVKPGTYVFTGTWNFSKSNVQVIGDNKTTCIIQNNNATECIALAASKVVSFEHMSFVQGTGSVDVFNVSNSTLFFNFCEVAGVVSAGSVVGDYTDFNNLITGGLANSVFTNCNFTTTGGVNASLVNTYFNGCNFTTTNTAIISNSVINCSISDSIITTSASTRSVSFTSNAQNCRILNTAITGTNVGGESIVHFNTGANNFIDRCVILGAMTATSTVSYGMLVRNNSAGLTVSNSTLTATGDYTTGIDRQIGTTAAVSYNNNVINALIGVNITAGTTGYIYITNNVFSVTSTLDEIGVSINNVSTPTWIGNNTFNVNGNTGGSKTGVSVVLTSVVSELTIINNLFNVNSASQAYGINAQSAASTSSLKIVGNTFKCDSTSSGNWTGVYTSNITATVVSNAFRGVTLTGAGILRAIQSAVYPAATRNIISNNTFTNLVAAARNTIYSNNIGAGSDFSIFSNNSIANCSGQTTFAIVDIGRDGALATTPVNVVSLNNFSNSLSTYGVRCTNGVCDISNNAFNNMLNAFNCVTTVTTLESKIVGNAVTGTTVATAFEAFNIGADSCIVSNNVVRDVESSGSSCVGLIFSTAARGVVIGNTFVDMNGTSVVGVQAATVAGLTVEDCLFSFGTVNPFAGVAFFNGSGLTISNNTFLSSSSNGTDVQTNGTVSNVTIMSNTFRSISTNNINVSIPTNTLNVGNYTISANIFDPGVTAIVNQEPITVLIGLGGASGGFSKLLISNNHINRANSSTGRGIQIIAGGVGGTYLATDVAVVGNIIGESGATLNPQPPISIGSTTVSLPIINCRVHDNVISQNATAGARSSMLFFAMNRFSFCGNIIHRDSGANSFATVSNVTGLNINNNLIQTDAVTTVFDGATGPSANGMFTGNTVQNTGATLISGFTNVTNASNKQW